MIKLLLSVLTGIVTVYLVYAHYLQSQKDIHELALSQQSNISPTRKSEHETAVYRSNLIPFEMPLVTGLSIRQGFKLRNGNLRDIWSVVFDQAVPNRSSRFTFIDDHEGVVEVGLDNLNAVMKRLAQYFTLNDSYLIGSTCSLYSYHSFITAMTCFTNGLTFQHIDLKSKEAIEVDLLLINEAEVNKLTNYKYKHLIIITNSTTTENYNELPNTIAWSELGDLSKLNDTTYEYKYDPKYDEGIPFLSTNQSETFEFTHQNFVSSIGSIVKSLPLSHEITSKDTLLIHGLNEFQQFPKIFAVLLFGGSVIFDTRSGSSLIETIEAHKPTILSISTASAIQLLSSFQSDLLKSSTLNQWLKKLQIWRAEHLLSEGIFSFIKSETFKTLRLIYISTLTPNESISSHSSNLLKIITGSRIIIERFIPSTIGSILSTNFYDYRIFTTKRILQNRGTTTLSLESKLFQYGELPIDSKHGELCIRGFIIGKPHDPKNLEKAILRGEKVGSEGWMPTGIVGLYGHDGCFYEDRE